MSEPREAVWLIEQLGKNSSIQMCYDYSHYAFRNLDLKKTIKTALPHLAHVAVKDAMQKDGKVIFVLPGERLSAFPRILLDTSLQQSEHPCRGISVCGS